MGISSWIALTGAEVILLCGAKITNIHSTKCFSTTLHAVTFTHGTTGKMYTPVSD